MHCQSSVKSHSEMGSETKPTTKDLPSKQLEENIPFGKILKGLYKDSTKSQLDTKEHETPVDQFFSPMISKMVQTVHDIRVSGFSFCSILNNARFNPWVHICNL